MVKKSVRVNVLNNLSFLEKSRLIADMYDKKFRRRIRRLRRRYNDRVEKVRLKREKEEREK